MPFSHKNISINFVYRFLQRSWSWELCIFIFCLGGKGVSLLAAVWDEYLHGQDRYIARSIFSCLGTPLIHYLLFSFHPMQQSTLQGVEQVPQLLKQRRLFPLHIPRVCPAGCQWQQRVCWEWIHEPGFFFSHLTYYIHLHTLTSPPASPDLLPLGSLPWGVPPLLPAHLSTSCSHSRESQGGTAPALGPRRLGGTRQLVPPHAQAGRGAISSPHCLILETAQPGGDAASEGDVQSGHAVVWVHLGVRYPMWQVTFEKN